MYCKKCGKQISDDSVFCNYCGANQISSPFGQNDQIQVNQKWEYKTILIPHEKFPKRYKLQLEYQKIPNSESLRSIWQNYKPQISELILSETNEGWEVDPSYFDETCLEYKIRNTEWSDLENGAKFAYILVTIITFGIGLLIIAYVLANATKVLEPTGVRVRLRRPVA